MHEVASGRELRRVLVGFEFVLAGIHGHQRLQQEGKYRHHHEEQHQRHGVRGGEAHMQAFVEPCLVLEHAKQEQEAEADRKGPGHALDHMAHAEVAEFVREDGFDLRNVEARQQGVEEHDALGFAEAGEIGVAMAAALAAVHHEQALRGETAAGNQAFDALLHLAFLHGRELVEQRGNEGRVDRQHQRIEHDPDHPDIQPPVFTHAGHQPEHREQQRQAEQRADHCVLDQISKVHSQGHLVEPEAALNAEGAIQAEWHFDHRHDHDQDADEQHAVADASGEVGGGQIVDGLQAAAERQDQQDCRVERDRSHVQACLGAAVFRCLLVGLHADLAGEGGRHRIAVGHDMPHVAQGEPQAHAGGDDEGGKKQHRKSIHV